VNIIVTFLRSGDVDSARRVAFTDHDKIRDVLGNNDDLVALIKKELFRGEMKHPWSVLERLNSKK
jgi:hypothetical protein